MTFTRLVHEHNLSQLLSPPEAPSDEERERVAGELEKLGWTLTVAGNPSTGRWTAERPYRTGRIRRHTLDGDALIRAAREYEEANADRPSVETLQGARPQMPWGEHGEPPKGMSKELLRIAARLGTDPRKLEKRYGKDTARRLHGKVNRYLDDQGRQVFK